MRSLSQQIHENRKCTSWLIPLGFPLILLLLSVWLSVWLSFGFALILLCFSVGFPFGFPYCFPFAFRLALRWLCPRACEDHKAVIGFSQSFQTWRESLTMMCDVSMHSIESGAVNFCRTLFSSMHVSEM